MAALHVRHGDPPQRRGHERRLELAFLVAATSLPLGPVNLALGGTVSAFAKPDALDAAYGKNPMGYTVFARFSFGD